MKGWEYKWFTKLTGEFLEVTEYKTKQNKKKEERK